MWRPRQDNRWSLSAGGAPPARGGVAAPDIGRREVVAEDEALSFAAAAEERPVGVPKERRAGGLPGPQDAIRHGKGEVVERVITLRRVDTITQ